MIVLFSFHLQKNINTPIGIYKLGSHRARLGILPGRTVITLSTTRELEEFLKANQEAYLVIRKAHWEREITNTNIEIIMADQIGIKTNIRAKLFNNLLNFEKVKKLLNSRETVYFMRSG